MRALRPPAIMQMGSSGLPAPMPEFSSINSSTYYRESHPRQRDRETGPEGPELAKKRPLRYIFLEHYSFLLDARLKRETQARESASRLATYARFFAHCSDETLSSELITWADDESTSSFMLQILIFAAISHFQNYTNKFPYAWHPLL